MSCRGCISAAGVVLSALLGASSSWAQAADGAVAHARLHLGVTRSPGAKSCASEGEIRSAVEERLGRSVFVTRADADMRAEVRARRRAARFEIEVVLFDRAGRELGTRRLATRARHCSALDDSLALVVALIADVTRSSVQPPPSGVEAPPPAPAPPPTPTPIEIPASTPAPREPVRVRPSLGVELGAGVLPGAALGLQLGVELVFPGFWPLALGVTHWGEKRVGATQGGRFGLTSLLLGVCPWSFDAGSLEASLCAHQLLGRMSAEAFGFEDPEEGDRWLAAFGAGLQAKQWLGRSFVSASARLLVPAIQRRYYVEDAPEETVYDAPWVLGDGTIAVGFEF